MTRETIHDVLAETLGLLAGKQDVIDQLVTMSEMDIPLDDAVRAELRTQSEDCRNLIARVQEAFLP